MSKAQKMYDSLMENFPAPGGGGAHVAFFKAGALGFRASVPEAKIVADVLENMPEGGRHVSDEEIVTGVAKGFAQAMHNEIGTGAGDAANASKIPRDAFARLVEAGGAATLDYIVKRSPVPLDFPQDEAGWRTLEALYNADDYLFVGGAREAGELGVSVRAAGEWISAFKTGGAKHEVRDRPFIVVNTLTGKAAPTKADPTKLSYRSDAAIRSWRYMVVEFDSVSMADQIAFWSVVKLPVAALVLSGGKSIHGWVQVDCADRVEWEREVESDLFPGYLVPLGVDGSCKNEARLSRMPGQVRPGTATMQRLIYLAPGGKAVCA